MSTIDRNRNPLSHVGQGARQTLEKPSRPRTPRSTP